MKTQRICVVCLSLAVINGTALGGGDDGSDWSSIRAAYEAGRHAFHRQPDGTHTAWNPGQQWEITFDDKGFLASPRNGSWSWGLELAAVNGQPVSQAAASASGQRLSYERGLGVEEWFVNDARGLEQGWTLRERVGLEETIRLSLAVRGSLAPSTSRDCIVFSDTAGSAVLDYAGLKAWDATGRVLTTHFEETASGFHVVVDSRDAAYPVTIDPLAQQHAYLKASNSGDNDNFGASVAIDGDTLVVGASGEGSSAMGVNGDQADNTKPGSGAVYVFVRSGGSWVQQAYLKASNPDDFDNFGNSVAISGDTLVVGAFRESSNSIADQTNNLANHSGAAYVFVRNGGAWTQQAYLKASNLGAEDYFGWSVAVSGNTIIVGAQREGSDAVGVNGDESNDLSPNAGAAYIFVRSGVTWIQQAYLKASNTEGGDRFGFSVSIHGDTAVVGAPIEGSNATGINGNELNNLALGSGAAYVFVRNSGTWSQQAYLKASNTEAGDNFGVAAGIWENTIVVGSPGEDAAGVGVNPTTNGTRPSSGAAYVFSRTGSTWTQQTYLKATNPQVADQFGNGVAIHRDTVVIGSPGDGNPAKGIDAYQLNFGASQSGAAYVYRRVGGAWKIVSYLKASNSRAPTFFGEKVAVFQDTVITGAAGEDSAATGINGNQSDISLINPGAAYIFDLFHEAVAKTSHAASGVLEGRFAALGDASITSTAELLWTQNLAGSGSTGGRNRAVFSTLSPGNNGVDLVAQSGSSLMGAFGLPANAKLGAFNAPIAHQPSRGLFQSTITGTGINAKNNRLLMLDDGQFSRPILRTGLATVLLGNAAISTLRQCLPNPVHDVIALNCQLGSSNLALVPSTSDTGVFFIDHTGAVQPNVSAREGSAAYDGAGTFSQFTPHLATGGTGATAFHSFVAAVTPPVGPVITGVFTNDTADTAPALVAAPSISPPGAPGTTFGAFTSLSQLASQPLYKATLKASPATSNEGLWHGGNLIHRKDDFVDNVNLPGVKITRINRFWPVNVTGNLQIVSLVTLGGSAGSGVNKSNNQALVLRQANGQNKILLRTGDAAPGVAGATVATISVVDVNPLSGHYLILGSMKATSPATNQALWTGITQAGNDTTSAAARLPSLRLRKGQYYASTLTPRGFIRSLAVKPPVDRTGGGARGLAQTVGATGSMVIRVIGDGKLVELVHLSR